MDEWKRAVAVVDADEWEIFELPESESVRMFSDQDYSIRYKGPIKGGRIWADIPQVPLYYRTFADLKDLVHIPHGFRKYGAYEAFAGCCGLMPSVEELIDFNTGCGTYAVEPLEGTTSPGIIDLEDLGHSISSVLARMFGCDAKALHWQLNVTFGEEFDQPVRVGMPVGGCIGDIIGGDEKFLMALGVVQPGDCTVVFSTGASLQVKTVHRASEMNSGVQRIVNGLALRVTGGVNQIIRRDCIVYRLAEDFQLDVMQDKALANAVGIQFNGAHLQFSYNAGFDGTVLVKGDNFIMSEDCPLQATGTLTIKGSGSLTLDCFGEMQPCIGIQTHTGMSFGRWEPGMGALDKIIIDGVKVICRSNARSFSLGSYGKSYVPVIECVNGGSISCPEVTGRRVMKRSGAEDLIGSTKRVHPAVYEIEKETTGAKGETTSAGVRELNAF